MLFWFDCWNLILASAPLKEEGGFCPNHYFLKRDLFSPVCTKSMITETKNFCSVHMNMCCIVILKRKFPSLFLFSWVSPKHSPWRAQIAVGGWLLWRYGSCWPALPAAPRSDWPSCCPGLWSARPIGPPLQWHHHRHAVLVANTSIRNIRERQDNNFFFLLLSWKLLNVLFIRWHMQDSQRGQLNLRR